MNKEHDDENPVKSNLQKKFNSDSQHTGYVPQDFVMISDPKIISLFTHKKKTDILTALRNNQKTIMELSKELGWNPGTVKRHLDDLLEQNLVKISQKIKNKFNITMKFYRVTAKKFHFEWDWP